jgi:NADPH-dependent 2,4-dienoyl-CoA reductase/sulfur reductase-like enzyme
MAHQFKYVIIGAGLAGASAIEGIRERDPSGSIALFGREGRLPYDRPPLSKGLWLGKAKLEDLPVHDEAFYKTNAVHLFLDNEITSLELADRLVNDRQGNHYAYQRLLLATGGTPRMLSFGNGIARYYRTVEDYLALRELSERSEEFVLIGGGFIGAELSAALLLAGKRVTMIFPEEFLLQKILPEDLAAYVGDEYRKKGVTLINNDVSVQLTREDGKPVVLSRAGKRISGDVVLAAIGLNLHTEMAARAGIKVDNGVVVDDRLRTSDPNVFAAGDLANFPSKLMEKNIRIEHWDNARAQGKHAGANMAGSDKPFTYLPFFYSDLVDLGFEAVGELDSRLQTFADWKEEFREGVVYYLSNGTLRGVLLWNVWEKVDAARHLINRKRTYRKPSDLKGAL